MEPTIEEKAIAEAQAERAAEAEEFAGVEVFALPAPTIGRVVWAVDFVKGARRIRKADVCFVHEDGRVNLAIINHDGTSSVAIGVHELGHYVNQPIGWEWPARA